MQYFRSNLSRLKGRIEDVLPDGEDLFGFAGVDRSLVLEAVELAYSLSREIAETDDGAARFEVIALKRYGSKAYLYLTKLLDCIANSDDSKGSFDKLLDKLSNLVERTKIVYLVVTKDGLRDDLELSEIRARTELLRKSSEELASIQESLASSREAIDADMSAMTEAKDLAQSRAEEIDEWYVSADAKHVAMSKAHESIGAWTTDIQEQDTKIRTLSKQVSEISAEAKSLKETLALQVEKGGTLGKSLEELNKGNKSLQAEIHLVLGDANRVGMAASFKERKDELDRPQKVWQLAFIATVVVIFFVAISLVLPAVLSGRDWQSILSRIAVTSPLIWLAWFAAKQYSFITRIREDYAFKFASSMAYEGHKNATREVDKSLEQVLLEFSLYNMAQNPIRLYRKHSDHATPVQELAAVLLDRLPNLKNVTYKTPGLGNISATLERNADRPDADA